MKNPHLTPDQAAQEILRLTKMTPEEYSTYVLEAGTNHARDILTRHLPNDQEIRELVLSDLIKEARFNFWTYFQNVVYLKNLYILEKFGKLPSQFSVQTDFHKRAWQNALLPFRIKTHPSNSFERILAAIIKSYHVCYITKEEATI
jgi:hypothetical protein